VLYVYHNKSNCTQINGVGPAAIIIFYSSDLMGLKAAHKGR